MSGRRLFVPQRAFVSKRRVATSDVAFGAISSRVDSAPLVAGGAVGDMSTKRVRMAHGKRPSLCGARLWRSRRTWPPALRPLRSRLPLARDVDAQRTRLHWSRRKTRSQPVSHCGRWQVWVGGCPSARWLRGRASDLSKRDRESLPGSEPRVLAPRRSRALGRHHPHDERHGGANERKRNA